MHAKLSLFTFVITLLVFSQLLAACNSRHQGSALGAFDPAPGSGSSEQGQTPSAADLVIAQQTFELINHERSKAGLKPLSVNTTCQAAAQAHSQDMNDRSYFSHDSQNESFQQRMSRWGLFGAAAGENIAMAPSPEQAVSLWMNSPGHRANILDPQFVSSGIGFINQLYTQCFYGK